MRSTLGENKFTLRRSKVYITHCCVVRRKREFGLQHLSGKDEGQPIAIVISHLGKGERVDRIPGGAHLIALLRYALPACGNK